MKHENLTEQIIRAFFNVYNGLGFGYLEKVYENAMLVELAEMGIKAEKQKKVFVYYKGHIVGDYNADLTVENVIVCELKSNICVVTEDENQLLNCLKATTFEVGLLLNFGKSPEIRRKVYDNEKKAWYTTRIRPA